MNNQPNIEIKRLIDVFESVSRAERKKQPLLGLKHSEIRVLLCLKDISYDTDGIASISEISKRMSVTSPTVTELVKALSSKGYIDRSTNSKDKRVVDLKLTATGEEIVAKGSCYFTALFAGLVDKLGPEKSEMLLELLEQVCEYLEDAHVEV